MQERLHTWPAASPGTRRELLSLHYGAASKPEHGAPRAPKAYIQCALHADEIPAMLVGAHLRSHLSRLEEQGAIEGEIVLVPMANPIGLSQEALGHHIGRFHLGSGVNFNRGYRHLTADLQTALSGQWSSSDAAHNTQLIRSQCRAILQQWTPSDEAQALKKVLQLLAIDADVVLDLHCDGQALMHLYAGTPLLTQAQGLARELQAQAVLLARESGDDPFDESVSRHWWELQEQLAPQAPIDLACFSATVELRGQSDVTHEWAEHDAQGILRFLQQAGHLNARAQLSNPGSGAQTPEATPLEGVDPITAPMAGVVLFGAQLGQRIEAGQTIGEVLDPLSGHTEPLISRVSGILFARSATRYAFRGERVAKIAGAKPFRTGKLLSA